jgi:small multidrug resistance pump
VARTWLLLALGIVLDVAGATCLKLSRGLVYPVPTVLMFACYAMSLSILAVAFRDMDLSVAYTIWSVTGITLVASIGIYAFGEPATFARVFWMTVILTGVVGLRWSSAGGSLR